MKFKERWNRFWNRDTDQVLYSVICILVVPALLMAGWYLWMTAYVIPKQIQGCMMLRVTGLYCPGCGGTRAVFALLSGDVIKSVAYHPAVLYGAVLFVVYFGSQTLMRLTKGKVKGLAMKPLYLYILLGIICVNFIIRNVLLLAFGIATL